MVEHTGTDKPRSRMPPPLRDTLDHDGREINPGCLHTLLSEEGQRSPGATTDLKSGLGLPQQLNSGPVPGVLSPAKDGLAVENVTLGAALGVGVPELAFHVHVVPC